MVAFTRSTVDHLFNTKYADERLVQQARRTRFLFDAMTKKPELGGKVNKFTYKLEYGNPQGIGATLALAQASQNVPLGVELELPEKTRYGSIKVNGPDHLAAQSRGAHALIKLWSEFADRQLDEFADSLAFEMYRSGNGIRGRRASESSDVTTLDDVNDAVNFRKNMIVGASPNSDGSSPRTGTTEITSVDEDAGTIGLDTSDITSYADNDYLFRSGDPGTGIEGLGALFPLTVAGGDSFRGINRSVDRRRLAGIAQDDVNSPVEVNIQKAAAKLIMTTKHHGTCIAVGNPLTQFEVIQRRDAKTVYDKVNLRGNDTCMMGWGHIVIDSAIGPIKFYCDLHCPTDRVYLLHMSAMCWSSLFTLTHIVKDDGKSADRLETEDAYEVRMRSISNIRCTAPGTCAVISV